MNVEEYTREYFENQHQEIIYLIPMYGENKTRRKKEIIEIDDFLLYGAKSVRVKTEDFGCFIYILGENNRIIAMKELKYNMVLRVEKDLTSYTYKYKFIHS